jgi:hypothetical protein
MKTQAELQQQMIQEFVSEQNVVTDVAEGTVLHGLFGTVSNVLEDLYSELDLRVGDLYIHQANGTMLDKLVEGNFGLVRNASTVASGYLLFVAPQPLFEADILGLFGTLSVALHDPSRRGLDLHGDDAFVELASAETGEVVAFNLALPQRLNLDGSAAQAQGGRDLGDLLLADLVKAARAAPRGLRFLALPVVSQLPGAAFNVRGGTVRSASGNLPRFLSFATNYPSVSVLDSLGRAEGVYDPDGVTYVASGIELFMAGGGHLTGGADTESDAAYRARFAAWLNTRPTGTLDALTDAARGTAGVADVQVRELDGAVELRLVPVPERASSVATLALEVRRNLEPVRAAGTRLTVTYAAPTLYTAVVHVRPASFVNSDLASTVKYVKASVSGTVGTLSGGEELTSGALAGRALRGLPNVRTVERVDLYYALTEALFPSVSELYLQWASSQALNWRDLNAWYLAQRGRPLFTFALWRALVHAGTTGVSPTQLVALAAASGRSLTEQEVTPFFPEQTTLYLEPFAGLYPGELSCVRNETLRPIKEEALKVTLLSVPPVLFKQLRGLSVDQRVTQSIKPDLNVLDIVCLRGDLHAGVYDAFTSRLGPYALVNNYEEPLTSGATGFLALAENPLAASLVPGMGMMVGVNLLENA